MSQQTMPVLDEPLDPELVPYIVERPTVGLMIQHPLVNGLYAPEIPHQNARMNELLRRKQKAMADTRARGDVRTAVTGIIERPFRLEILQAWRRSGQISTAQWLDLLPDVWSDAEPDDTKRKHVQMFIEAKAANGGRILMDSEDKIRPAWFGQTEVVVYRGVASKDEVLGLAWTTDRAVAKFFALRYSNVGWVVTGRVRVRNVLCWNTTRGESEVDLDPKRATITDWEEVSA